MSKIANVEYDEKARRESAAMIAAEERALAQRRTEAAGDDCPCRDGMFPTMMPSRRGVLFAAGSTAGAAAAALLSRGALAAEGKAPPGAVHYDVPSDPTKEQGRPTGAEGGYGTRSQSL